MEARILGFKTANFEVLSDEYVYVPYQFYRYEFKVNRKTLINKSGKFDKKGFLCIIFDNNEAHPFECDMEEMGKLGIVRLDPSDTKGKVLKATCSDEEARKEVEQFIQNKILRRIYASSGEIKLLEEMPFYRPAKRLSVKYNNNSRQAVNERFAYLDAYGVVNEHILGLKVRVGGG